LKLAQADILGLQRRHLAIQSLDAHTQVCQIATAAKQAAERASKRHEGLLKGAEQQRSRPLGDGLSGYRARQQGHRAYGEHHKD